MACFFTHRALT